jgi:hypothetical protein
MEQGAPEGGGIAIPNVRIVEYPYKLSVIEGLEG